MLENVTEIVARDALASEMPRGWRCSPNGATYNSSKIKYESGSTESGVSSEAFTAAFAGAHRHLRAAILLRFASRNAA